MSTSPSTEIAHVAGEGFELRGRQLMGRDVAEEDNVVESESPEVCWDRAGRSDGYGELGVLQGLGKERALARLAFEHESAGGTPYADERAASVVFGGLIEGRIERGDFDVIAVQSGAGRLVPKPKNVLA